MPDASDSILPDYQGLPRPVTRFAPSPTGYLHIGGARTALFNYLYARRHGGTFLLRIEDTDRARSTEDAIGKILDGMAWLGLDADRPPLFQFARADRHAAIAHRLLAEGRAYRCYATAQELEAMREAQKAKGLPQRYDGRWRGRTDWPEGQPYVVRLQAPQDGETVIDDQVQGRVRQANGELDDFVLLRSDGTPTYMLAVVVDDHDMGVSHVIRGDDHLTNTFRQLALIRALGWPEPVYAHVPMIHGPDGAKLSKRHGALGVEAYRDEMGILPEALENYLLRLGWAHGDTELVARAEAAKLFDLDGVGRSPGRFDLKKLESVNAHYLKLADNGRLAGLAAPRMEALLGRELSDSQRDLLLRSMDELKPRAKNLNELAGSALFLVRSRPLPMDEGAAKLLDDAGLKLLGEVKAALEAAPQWEREALEATAKQVAEAAGLGLGKVAGPLRAALTGQTASPSVFAILALLGREESLGRITDALK
ncbi:glutamate--tRNA ligase [Sandaracinobacter sp. RS1-74]|uniref:glutamate--tRNA ligase n=1 Tax=Sandaracinobacteroides sayramensis TaxID=2913411 RepID=UPI001EDB3618|nr:glutamate--tRNA ligase [Sandaracinobacteroides sayramensis]MCG2841590.1 glutamate--tRNA ligase [Sandaracinobacteroides sayramensis]